MLKRQHSTDPALECLSVRSRNGPGGPDPAANGASADGAGAGTESENENAYRPSFHQLYRKCAPQFKEQGLNIINRQRFFGANYTQLHRREDKYYSLRNLRDMEEWGQNGDDLQFPDLRLLSGYKSTVVYANECIVKTQLAHKLITKHSIHDLIRAHGVDRVDSFIKGKRAITSYRLRDVFVVVICGANGPFMVTIYVLQRILLPLCGLSHQADML